MQTSLSRNRIMLAVGVLSLAILACGPVDTIRDIAAYVFGPTPTSTPDPFEEACALETYRVTKTADTDDGICTPDDCSLREAVITANRCPGGDEIQMAAETYVLSAYGALTITEDLVVLGGGATIEPPTLFITGTGTNVEINNLTIRGLIDNAAELTLNDVRIVDSRSGALFNTGTATMNGGAVLGNTVLARLTSSSRAGGVSVVRNRGGLMVFNGTEIANNSLVAEYEGEYVPLNAIENGSRVSGSEIAYGTLRMTGVLLHDNNAFDGWGSALINYGNAELDHVTIYGHDDSAIITGGGSLNIVDSSIHDNPGGAIAVDGRGSVAILRTTIAGNGAGPTRETVLPCGTITAEGSSIRIENSTISGNDPLDGCVVLSIFAWRGDSPGTADIVFSTIYANHQAAVQSNGGTAITRIRGSILANNTGGNCLDEGFSSLGSNLFDDLSCSSTPGPGDRVEVGSDLRILPLADNGGYTMTHALLAGSPAIDLGGSDCPATDQRSFGRPVGPGCDAGAFEAGASLAAGTPVPFSGEVPAGFPTGPVTCRSGPATVFPPIAYFDVGQELQLQSRDADASWLEVHGQGKPPCWVKEDLLEIDPGFNLMDLPPGLIPPTPTWTAVPPTEKPDTGPQGCKVYNNQTQQEVCYPIAQCPVPFNQSLGACTP